MVSKIFFFCFLHCCCFLAAFFCVLRVERERPVFLTLILCLTRRVAKNVEKRPFPLIVRSPSVARPSLIVHRSRARFARPSSSLFLSYSLVTQYCSRAAHPSLTCIPSQRTRARARIKKTAAPPKGLSPLFAPSRARPPPSLSHTHIGESPSRHTTLPPLGDKGREGALVLGGGSDSGQAAKCKQGMGWAGRRSSKRKGSITALIM